MQLLQHFGKCEQLNHDRLSFSSKVFIFLDVKNAAGSAAGLTRSSTRWCFLLQQGFLALM